MKYRPREFVFANRVRVLVVATVMFVLALLVSYASILSQNHSRSVVSAAGCWRNTACTGPSSPAFPGSWDKYNYAPASRTVSPSVILSPNGEFISDYPGNANLKGDGAQLIFDFKKEVAGIVTVTYSATGAGSLGLAFSEAKNFTGKNSDSSSGSFNTDGALFADVSTTEEANYTMPDDKIRGGFRYLTIFTRSSSNANLEVEIVNITLEIGFQPAWSNLQAYQGYFSSSDDLLNKIWYAGAYTLQTNAIPPSTGRAFPIIGGGWENNMDLNLGTTDPTIYVDGSKRDRTVWAGDLAIAVPSILVSTGDADGVRNTLQVLWNDQANSGALPFAGPAINIYNSDTYHMATLIGTYNYILYTNDLAFLSTNYGRFQKALAFITAKIDETGMLDVTGAEDWGRLSQGGHNTEANMLMYRTLSTASALAGWNGDSTSSTSWASLAATLKTAVNRANYDTSVGAFKDSDTDATIHPEDGNSMALVFDVANASYYAPISKQLTSNWIGIGAVAPELPNNLVGFVQSFEVKAHLAAREATRALDLTRRAWGWYLNNPFGTASTCIEGYPADGSFGYRATTGYGNDYSYTSHAHGWSTGPTDALTSYIVGMRPIEPAGSVWRLAPQFGDLSHAEGGFTTPLGKFQATWTLFDGGYSLEWSVPSGTSGTVVLPAARRPAGQAPKVVVDGGNAARVQGSGWDVNAGTLTIAGDGGKHSAKVTY